LEEKIAWLENEIKCLEDDLAAPPSDPGQVQQMAVSYARLQAELEAHLEKWSDLHDTLNQ
jgi:hypothetical protein